VIVPGPVARGAGAGGEFVANKLLPCFWAASQKQGKILGHPSHHSPDRLLLEPFTSCRAKAALLTL